MCSLSYYLRGKRYCQPIGDKGIESIHKIDSIVFSKQSHIMKTVKTLFIAAALLTLGACGPTLTPFTERLYEQNRWTEQDLKRIQFYVSNDIVLRRDFSSSDSRIEGGTIRIIGGKQVEEVVIREGTPGVFLSSPKTNRFAISFEEGGEERYLMFGPNPRVGGRFALLASDWDRREGTVTYEGRRFRIDADSAYSSLLVDLKKSNSIAVKSRTASGRKVN